MPQHAACRMARAPAIRAGQELDASWAPHRRLEGALDVHGSRDLTGFAEQRLLQPLSGPRVDGSARVEEADTSVSTR